MLDKQIRLADIIQIGLLLAAILIGWIKLDNRVQALENVRQEQTDTNKQTAAALSEVRDTLQKINQTWAYFPPHVHIDHDIIYPDGHRERDPK